MLENVDDDEKVRNIVTTLGGPQNAWFLMESGLYEVLFQSRKPIAKAFKKEVKAVLKELRTRGFVAANVATDFADKTGTLAIESLAIPFGVSGNLVDMRAKIENILHSVGLFYNGVPTRKALRLGAFLRVDCSIGGRSYVDYRLTRDGYAYVVGLRALQAPEKTRDALQGAATTPEKSAVEALIRWIESLGNGSFLRSDYTRKFQNLGKRERNDSNPYRFEFSRRATR